MKLGVNLCTLWCYPQEGGCIVEWNPGCDLFVKGKAQPINLYFFMAYLTAEKKQELFGKYGKSNTDTGSPESQIALFSYRISHLTEHLKSNKHDFGTQRSLLRLVGKRRKLLMYLKEVDIERYRAIIKTLNLRK